MVVNNNTRHGRLPRTSEWCFRKKTCLTQPGIYWLRRLSKTCLFTKASLWSTQKTTMPGDSCNTAFDCTECDYSIDNYILLQLNVNRLIVQIVIKTLYFYIDRQSFTKYIFDVCSIIRLFVCVLLCYWLWFLVIRICPA